MAQIDAEPLPGKVDGEQRDARTRRSRPRRRERAVRGDATGGSVLADALNDAARGDGTTLLAALATRTPAARPGGAYDNSQAAFFGIGCLDAPAPPVDELPAVAAARSHRPRRTFGASTTWLSSPCTVWPVPAGRRSPRRCTAPGAPPIVVLGTSNDPATPLQWAAGARGPARVRASRRRIEGEGHTAYGRGNECIDDAVDDYLVDLERSRRTGSSADGARVRVLEVEVSMRIALPRTIL